MAASAMGLNYFGFTELKSHPRVATACASRASGFYHGILHIFQRDLSEIDMGPTEGIEDGLYEFVFVVGTTCLLADRPPDAVIHKTFVLENLC